MQKKQCTMAFLLAAISLPVITSSAQAGIVRADVAHHFSFDTGLEDVVPGSGVVGEAVGNSGVSTAQSVAGGASLRNDAGTNKDGTLNAVRLPGIVPTLNQSEFSVAMWFRADPLPANPNNEMRFPRFFEAVIEPGLNGRGIQMGTRPGGGWLFSSFGRSAPGSAPPEQWNHAAMIRDNDEWSVFLNGEAVAETVDGPNLDPFTSALLGATAIGTARTGEILANNRDFTGYLDELSVFSRAITPEEVSSLYSDPSLVSITAVPEPSSLGVFACLIIGAVVYAGRKQFGSRSSQPEVSW
jgi:hypothetical protein